MGEPQPRKSLAVSDRLGVYKRLADVPDRYRLHHYTEAYADRDAWQEFCDQHEYAQGNGADFTRKVDRVGDRWRSFMDRRDRHHALARPEDVDEWCIELRESFSTRGAHDRWRRVDRFFDWLQWHSEHPHVYNPALMAVTLDSSTYVLWEWWKTQIRRRRREYEGENQ